MKFYKVIMSRGEPLIIEENRLNAILKSPSPLIKVWNKDKTKFNLVNRSHIVQAYFDHETNKQEFELVDGVYKLKKDIVPVA